MGVSNVRWFFVFAWLAFSNHAFLIAQVVTVAQPTVNNTDYLRQLSQQGVNASSHSVSTGPEIVPASHQTVPKPSPASASSSFGQPNLPLRQPFQYASAAATPSVQQAIAIETPELNTIPSQIQPANHSLACDDFSDTHMQFIPDGCQTLSCRAWTNCMTVFTEGLYIRPRNAEIAYAVPIDGPITAPPANHPIQIGQVGVVDPDYEIGYAIGGRIAMDSVSSIEAKFSTVEFLTSNSIQTSAPAVLRSLVSHPSTISVATDFLSADANLAIEYETIDLSLRHLFVGGGNYAVNYYLGARYSQLDQRFDAIFVDNETETVSSDIDFEGVGLRIGLEAEKHVCCRQIRFYARGMANFLAGRFRGSYFQGSSFDPEIVNTQWHAGRIVPTLDLEVGFGWRSCRDRFRVSAGYRVDTWFNMVTNEEFIWAVQQNNFLSLHDSMTFDGLVAQAEWRF